MMKATLQIEYFDMKSQLFYKAQSAHSIIFITDALVESSTLYNGLDVTLNGERPRELVF